MCYYISNTPRRLVMKVTRLVLVFSLSFATTGSAQNANSTSVSAVADQWVNSPAALVNPEDSFDNDGLPQILARAVWAFKGRVLPSEARARTIARVNSEK